MQVAFPVPISRQGNPPPCITNNIQVQAELHDETLAEVVLREDENEGQLGKAN
jgi:hypothetical protein